MTAMAATRIPGTPDPWWEASALNAIETLAKTGKPFTAAHLTDLGVTDPDHPCRWGSVFAKAKALGLIRRNGFTRSRRAGRNGGYCLTWIGV